MRRRRVLSESGVSLVEPLVAMVVLSLSLLGSVGMFAAAQDGISGGAKSLEALALAESRMERLRALPYRNLLSSGLDGDAVAGDGEYTARRTVDGIVLTWSVRPDQPNLADSRGAQIRVSAEWSGRGGQPRKIRLGMRKANPVFSGAAS